MVDREANTRRLAKNTVLLTFRSLFNLFCSLYSSRLILQALGVEDYGIYNAIAGFVSMFVLVTGSMGSAIGRFITIELGKNDEEQLRKVFSISFTLMLFFALVVLILTETFGLWFLNNKMTITPGRENAAFWTFQFSVITILSSMIIVPYNAEVIAHEKMGIYAYTGIAETLLRLVMALFMVYGTYHIDRLVLYGLIGLFSTLSIQLFVVCYCRRFFQECRFKLFFEKKLFSNMFSYASWNFIEQISSTFSGQGVNMAINVFLGPVINSARGLTNTVSTVVHLFVKNFTTALSPQITKSYAANELDYMKMLTFRGSKFSYYIMFFLALPLFLEVDFALSVWLVEVPRHTANFVRLSLLFSLLGVIDAVFRMPKNATQDIRNYKIIVSIIEFMNFPLSYLALKNGLAPEWIFIIAILLSFPRIYTIQKIVSDTFHYSVRDVFESIYLRLFLVTITAAIIPTFIHLNMPQGWWRMLAVGFTSVLCTAAAVYSIGCNEAERVFIKESITKFIARFRHV